jgi:hypothetical protein
MQIFRDSTRKRQSLDSKIQSLTVKETTSKAHMQVRTNKESCEKQAWKKSGLKWVWADRPSPFRAWFDASFDLAASRAIYSPLIESHEEIHLSSAAEEQRREGHRSGRRGSRWLTRVPLADMGTLH